MKDRDMEDCCTAGSSPASGTPAEFRCPRDGSRGRKVNTLTIRALLRKEYKHLVLDGASYRFCASPGCGVVYFDESGWTAPKEYLAVRVGSKETEDPIPVCYCYGYSREDIRREIRETGTTTIPEKIRAEVKAGRCECEVKNPSGACCLGNVEKAVRGAQAEIAQKERPMNNLEAASTPTKKNVSGMVLGGALATGFLASACCLGPLLLALLGLGGAGALLKFEPYRPYFAALTVILLAAGFFYAYRKPVPGVQGDTCGCEMPTANRTGRVMLWTVTAVVAFFLAFPWLAQMIWG